MEITKYGDFYNVSDTKSTYGISGNLIKSLSGEIIIDVYTHVLNDTTNIISLIHGSYNPQQDTFNVKVDTKASRGNEQVDSIKTVLDAINQLLNDDL